jgi:hypothetical protein
MKLPFLVILSASLVLNHAVHSAETLPDPPDLIAKRTEYLRELQRVSAPVLSNYLHQLEAMKEQYTRRGDLHAAESVDSEIRKINLQLTAAAATSQGSRASVPLPVEITLARWQGADPNQSADVTAHLKEVMESGAKSVTVNTQEAAGGVDPARGKPKTLYLEYRVNGKVKQKTLKEGGTLSFSELK